MADLHELHSFLTKFVNLQRNGRSCRMTFECKNGETIVNMEVRLENPLGKAMTTQSSRSRPSPSRLRRRERRRQARLLAAENAGTNLAQGDTEIDLSSDTHDAAQATQLENSELIADDDCSSRYCNDGTILMATSSESIENEITSYEFSNGVSEILRDLSSSDLIVDAFNASNPSSPTTSSSLCDLPSNSTNQINQNEFYEYMENFSRSLGTILEKKLASVIGDPT